MYRSAMGVWVIFLCVTVFVCVSAIPASFPSQSKTSHRQLLRLAKVLNSLRKLELGDKETLSQALRNHQSATNHIRGDYRKHGASRTSSSLQNQNEAEQYKNLDSYIMADQNGDSDLSKRQGNWDYDYGLGGGRFGKRTPGDYGIGGGRFGRDVMDVDHVDLTDSE